MYRSEHYAGNLDSYPADTSHMERMNGKSPEQSKANGKKTSIHSLT